MRWCICSRGLVYGPFADVNSAWSWFESRELPGAKFARLVGPGLVECLASFFPGPKLSKRSRRIARVVEKQPGDKEMDNLPWSVVKCGKGGAPEFVVGPFVGQAAAVQWVSDNSRMVGSWSSYRFAAMLQPEVFDAIRDAARRAQFKLVE